MKDRDVHRGFFNLFLLKLIYLGIYQNKGSFNRDTRFNKAVLLLCEHGKFSLNLASHGLSCPPPQKKILLGSNTT